MTKQDTINANVCLLAQQAHDAGVESGTVLHYRTGDAPEPVSPVTLMGCTFTYQGLDDDKALLGCKLKDKLLGTAPVDNVEPMRFATELVMKTKGYQPVGHRWVNPDEPAGAKAIELGMCKWPGLANNPEYLTSKGKVYAEASSVGTTLCSTVRSVKPDTLRNPIEGSEMYLPVKTSKKRSRTEDKEESEESEDKEESAESEDKEESAESEDEEEPEPVAPPKKIKKAAKKGPKKEILMKMVGKGCPKGNLGTIHAYILEHVDDHKKLAKIHARYFGKTPPPPAGGKQPNPAIMQSIMREELRDLWGL